MKTTMRHWAAATLLATASVIRADEFSDLAKQHPASAEIDNLFKNGAADFHPTELTRKDYLPVIAGVVDYWKHFQSPDGAIIDPYEKKERQYSTPAFALAAAILVQDANRPDLLDPASRAMTFATSALANKTTADRHADFYIPMLIHAHRILSPLVPKDVSGDWDRKLRSLVPEKTYRDTTGGGNWNIVNVSGELLRRKDGLVPPAQTDAHAAYIEKCLAHQQRVMTPYGMYRDPNSPLAYDAFPRLWLEDVFADNAYTGPQAAKVNQWLRLGGISSLLLLSPSGEWACGGRSGQHQWNEAENAVIAECNANYWHHHGNEAVAGAFKRAARLCLSSLKRWQRPSGEFWIVKNFADPARRFAYESYSYNSQYNLLPAAMLAIAYERADDAIQESPKPGENEAYLFDLRDIFHKIVASVGGNYIEIDTAADPHYNATGLQRLHHSGVPLSPLSESAPAHRSLEPWDEQPRDGGFTPGIQWRDSQNAPWRSLGDFASDKDGVDPKKPPTDIVADVHLTVAQHAPTAIQFALTYTLKGESAHPLTETYTLTPSALELTSQISGDPAATRVALPVLISDGIRMSHVTIDGPTLRVDRVGGSLTYELLDPAGLTLHLDGPKLISHNGYIQSALADLPPGTKSVKFRITLEPGKDAAK